MFRFFAALAWFGALLASTPAAAAPPPVEAYGKLPSVEQVKLSPSGQRYGFITVIGDARTLVVMTVDGAKVLVEVPVGKAKIVDLAWAGEDHLLVTISQTVRLDDDQFEVERTELDTVMAINVPKRQAVVVFDKHGEVSPAVLGRYGVAEVGGRWYGYFGAITFDTDKTGAHLEHTWPDLYRVDLDSGSIMLAARGSERADGWLVGPDGVVIARASADEKTGDWQVTTGDARGRIIASGKSLFESVGVLARGRTPNSILIERPTDLATAYQEIDLTAADPAKSAQDVVADEVLVDPVSGLWLGTLLRGDQPEPTFFNPVAQARVRGAMKAFKDLNVSLESFTPDMSRMVVETSGTGDSGTYWLVDIAAHSAGPIGYERPTIQPADVGPIEMVDWKAADGLDLRGVLSLPPGREARNLPVVVMPHGGPEVRDYPVFDWWAQLFVSRGYAVFQPNFRGSSGYGVKFRDAGFGEWGRKMQTDVSDGLFALASRGIVDPKRACIVGWSYGGYAAEAGITIQHGLYRCAVSMAGVADPSGLLSYARAERAGETGYALRYWRKFMGVTSGWGDELKPISPLRRAAEADAPILLIHGKDDTVVPIEQSQAMERALKAAGKPVEFVTLPGADHWLLHEDTRLAMAKASLDFVLKYDPPDPDPTATSKP